MSTSNMKEISLKSVGGRIRKARTDALFSIKELSEKIGISFAYLGMVERGERNPSDKILSSIADETGTSIEWLKNGSAPPPDDVRMDVSLFLNLVLHEAQEISPAILSTILAIDDDELNSILSEHNIYNPIWYAGCSTLAQRLDIPKLLDKLSEIEYFLNRTKNEMLDFKLIDEIRKTLSETLNDKFEFYRKDVRLSTVCPDPWSISNESSKPTRDFSFQQESTQGLCRVLLYIPLLGVYADRIDSIISDALETRDSDVSSIALIFSDKPSFDKSKALVANKIRELSLICPLKHIVVMLIDQNSLRIEEKESFPRPAL